MCGIAGIWGKKAARNDLKEALSSMVHRGPDGEGIFEDGLFSFGMRRLAVIDIAGGNQPLFNEDQSIAVIVNGEIYNYIELVQGLKKEGHLFKSASDSEVLLHLYEARGEQFVEDLRGMFAFALWDRNREKLYLGRDRLGKKPLYYTTDVNGGIAFASEIKALRPLARALGLTWRLRDQAVYDYLSLGVVLQPETFFEGVHMLPPATMLKHQNGHSEKRQYWSLRPRKELKISYLEGLEAIRLEVAESVKIRLRSDLPVGVLLSGGIDSSLVAYEAAQAMGGNVRTFTISNKEKILDESAAAHRTAEYLGIRNETLEIDVPAIDLLEKVVAQFDQPFADSSAIPCFAISQLARKHVTVVLNGDGGDELFAGYRRHVAAYYFKHIPLFLDNRLVGDCGGWVACRVPRRSFFGFLFRSMRGFGLTNGLRYLLWTTDMLCEKDKKNLWIRKNKLRSTEAFIEDATDAGLSGLTWQMDADLRINLCNDLLVKMDMTTMAFSLEARSPLLDHRLSELAASLPESFLVKNGRTKCCLRDAYKERLPREIITGKKRGFEIPLDKWLKEDWKSIINDVVLSGDAEIRSFIDAKQIHDIFMGKVFRDRNLAYIKYALLVLELWLRQRR